MKELIKNSILGAILTILIIGIAIIIGTIITFIAEHCNVIILIAIILTMFIVDCTIEYLFWGE